MNKAAVAVMPGPRVQESVPYPESTIRLPQQKLIERPRLARLMEAHDADLIVLLRAPAGYGKTALLQQRANACQRNGDIVAWMTLERRDVDPMSFAMHLVAALEKQGVVIEQRGPDTMGNMGFYSWQAVVQQICLRLSETPGRCRIVIDDAHIVALTPAAECLDLLIREAPEGVQFLISTRGETGLPLGHIRAHREILELDMQMLRFLEDETQDYLTSRSSRAIPQDQVRLVQNRSEGWIVGIKLFSMAVDLEPENERILESFSGERRQIAEFFVEDVFSRLSEDLQEFLLRSSLLDRFCPALCDAALELGDCAGLIERCETAGLFVQPLDEAGAWYRYHQLFAGFLRRQLHDRAPDVVAGIYHRAAQWLDDNGDHVEAFNCAISGRDMLFAAEILDRHCETMFSSGLQPTVQKMAELLPPHLQTLFPRLMLVLAWRLLAQWRVDEAKGLVDIAQRRLTEMERSGELDAQTIAHLRFSVAHRECQIAQTLYQVDRLESLSSSVLGQSALPQESQPSGSHYLMSSLYNSLQYAQREQFRLSKVDRLDALARDYLVRSGTTHGLVFIAGITGPSLMLMGQTARAREMLEEGVRLATEVAGRGAPLGTIVGPSLAALCYECNELDRARELVAEHVPHMTTAGLTDQLLNGWITQARLQLLDGEVDACLETLENAARFASRHELDRLRVGVYAEHLRILLKLGRPDDAARFARRRGLVRSRTEGTARKPTSFTMLDGVVAQANCRLMAADDRFGEALALARQWRSFVTSAQAVHAAVEWDILLAELLLMSGERLAARRALSQALEKAAPCRLLRRFLDEGEPISGLLHQMAQAEGDQNPFLTELVSHLEPLAPTEEFEDEQDDMAICGKINGREIEILTLVSSGMLNRQIGEQLGLTEGTVKWYLQQVYDKVGIRNRKLVVSRLRRLGLIP